METGRRLRAAWSCACVVTHFLLVGQVLMTLLVCRSHSAALPVSSSSVTDYLVQFGYMPTQDPKTGALRSEAYVKNAIRAFQKMAGINQTGVVDGDTLRMMKMPRCGNLDNIQLGKGARKKRYALQGSKWGRTELTYRISVYPTDLGRKEVDDEIRKALQVWGDVTPLQFTQKYSGSVDLDVKFVRGAHGDGNAFDGRGRTLAHAFFPQWGGDAHFDDEEVWTIAQSSGVNLFQVAAHEFGHSLGLSHSDTSAALMAPFYRGYQRNFELDDDDVRGVQELYGPPRRMVVPTTPRYRGNGGYTRGPPVSIPPICRRPSVDAIVMDASGKTYIFQGRQYYRLSDYGIDEGYPRSIADDWGLTGPVDCALHWDNGYTFIFKGEYYWKFYNFNLIYVRRISEGFKGVPNNLDAAFVWGGNGKTYFIKDDLYWRYTENSVDREYPRPLSVWSGLPPRVDAAIKWRNGRTYFFRNSLYYRYNDVEFNIDQSYPRNIGNWWLGCPEETRDSQQDSRSQNQHSGSQLDGRAGSGVMAGSGVIAGSHSIAGDNSDQFIRVQESTTEANYDDSSANRSSRVATSSFVMLCGGLYYLMCR